MSKRNFLALSFSCFAIAAQAQGTFQNLDFEAANVPNLPLGQGEFVAVSNGLPGWSVYIGTAQQVSIPHNSTPLGAAQAGILGPDWPSSQILQGSYSPFIASSSAGPPNTAAIAQSGQIPAGAKSVTFYLAPFSGLRVDFAGQQIPIIQIGTGANYDVFGGDVTAFAGATGELRFTSLPGSSAILDNIIFSSQSIPEPSVPALSALGVLLFVRRFLPPKRPT